MQSITFQKTIMLCLLLALWVTGVCAKDNVLIGVKVMPMPDNRVRIDFQFENPMDQLPASFITEEPPRLVLDFINSSAHLNEAMMSQQIKVGALTEYKVVAIGHRVRAMLSLTGSVTYMGDATRNVYTLIISGKGEQLIPRNKELFVTHRDVHARFGITGIQFRGASKQGGRLIIDVTDPGIPTDVVQTGKNIVVNFMSTRIPENLMKRYDVEDFQSPTQFITAVQEGKSTRITLQNKGDYGHFAYQVNRQFIIDVFPLSAEELQAAKLKKKVFLGKRISLNFQDIQVRAVLQLLADFTGVNLVVSDTVLGNITLRLNNVPWDQALDIILTTQGLGKRQMGNVILIDKASAFVTRETEDLKEQLAQRKLAPLRSELLQINYAKAADIAVMLKDRTNSLLSERGSLSVDVRTNTIWLQDTGSQIEIIRTLVSQLDVPVRQVVIEARIVDVSKKCELDLGIAWGVSKPTHLSGTLAGANQMAQGIPPALVTPLTQRLNLDLPATPTFGAQAASVGLAVAKLGDGFLLDLELSALESVGNAEIIASPRLMTTNQQPAVISSGEDIPYQQSTSSGATAVAFKQAVLSLKVTPQITPDNKLLMDLYITQDADSGDRVNGVPIILTKSIQTNVLVNNGQTIVLGGIYKADKSNTIIRIPFLGSLPFVGHLFSSTSVKSDNEELLIFITPRIITSNLSITAIEGMRQRPPANVALDKFGKQVVIPPQYLGEK
ncbi:MAG: type IV pilus secretin PilQ [Legionellales bacterium]|nr:type IV pilus secretin PilQ [Legionellales bacterium]